MARSLLQAKEGSQIRVWATIDRYGRNSSTYLLTDLRDADDVGRTLTDHLWIPIGKWASGFRAGDEIEITGTVEPYVKGWLGDPLRAPLYSNAPTLDWTLGQIRDAKVTKFGPVIRMMDDGSIQGG